MDKHYGAALFDRLVILVQDLNARLQRLHTLLPALRDPDKECRDIVGPKDTKRLNELGIQMRMGVLVTPGQSQCRFVGNDEVSKRY